jgi:gamma-glutamyltranspeptidase / glutathione hydrolase
MADERYRRHAPARQPTVASGGMVATSQAAATQAGLRMLERGGNAADAVLAAAAVLSVTEPMSTGIGGDAFAIVAHDGEVVGLDAAGPAPAEVIDVEAIADRGPRSVDVPGAVAGWASLADRFGRFGLDVCLSDAIDVAERGFALGAHTTRAWRKTEMSEWLPALRTNAIVRSPNLATTLRRIAEQGPNAFYHGRIAEKIAAASWLSEQDLANYRPRWSTPLETTFAELRVLELPPPTQGVAALEALKLLERLGGNLSHQVLAVHLALEDAFSHVRDKADVSFLLTDEHLEARLRSVSNPARELPAGTVYLCAVDEQRMAVSFIQSLYMDFGSGIVVPSTGIALNNRAACFAVNGSIEPGRRPYHTIIPGLLLRSDGSLVGPFGIMGGFIQAQAHVQFVAAVSREGLDPQAILDRPRFRVDGLDVHLEPGLWNQADELKESGFKPLLSNDVESFGGGQAIFCCDDILLGGSDARKDGYAAGI